MEDHRKHILIISYFFPPCGLTASRRTESWAKEWSKMGYKVSVVTRKWEHPVRTLADTHHSTSPGVNIDDTQGFTVHQVPYTQNKRDQLLHKGKYTFLRKLLTVKELLLQPIRTESCPFSNVYTESRKICKEQDVDLIIVSGNPFILFKFGYLLNKEFSIPWVADYRDAWTTSLINKLDKGSLFQLFSKYEKPFERKWVQTASLVTASSRSIGQSIEKLTGTKCVPIYNGFDEDLFKKIPTKGKYDKFTITYVGTLYQGQNIELFLEGYKRFVDQVDGKVNLLMPGLNIFPEQLERVKQAMTGYEHSFESTDRIPHDEILEIELRSDLLLHVAWKGYEGIIASKIYEYIGSGTPIMVCPGDNSDIDQIINESGTGTICNNSEEVLEHLLKIYKERGAVLEASETTVEQFTRKTQAKELQKVIQPLLNMHHRCLQCGSSDLETLLTYKKAHLSKCRSCDFIFSRWIPTEEELTTYYEEEYERNDYLSPVTRTRYNELLDQMEPFRKTGKLLDVGTGIGFFAEEAIKRGWEVHGVELTDEAIEICESKGVKMIKGILDAKNYAPESFDIITSFEVIEHINNPADELENYQKLLRKGGLVYVTTPNFNSLLRYRLKDMYNVILYPEHLSYYTPKTLKQLFRRFGFKTKKFETTGISLTRLRTSKGVSDQEYISETSDDEIMRTKIEQKRHLQLAKKLINKTLTLTGTGDSLKGWFVKN